MSEHNKNIKWALVVVIVAFIVTLIMLIGAKKDLTDVTERFEGRVVDYKTEIEDKCGDEFGPSNVAKNPECKAVLEDFEELLQRYLDTLNDSGSEGELETE